MVREKNTKEREEIKKFKEEEFIEKKRLKSLQVLKRKQEEIDDIKRNLEKSKIIKALL